MDAGSIIILVAIVAAILVAAGMFFLSPRKVDAPDTELLKQLFAVSSFDPETKLFMIMPDALGFGVVMSPMPGADAGLREKLNSLLSMAFPADTIVQCTMWKSPDIEQMLAVYERSRRDTKHPQIREITKKRVEFLRGGTSTPVDKTSGITLHDTRVILTVRVPVGPTMPSAAQIQRVADLQKAFMQSLKSAGLHGEALEDEGYLRILQTIFNQGPNASWRTATESQVEPSQFLQHQILDPNVAMRVTPQAVYLGEGLQARTLMIKRFPETTYFGMAMKYLADISSGTRGIRNNCLITLNLIYPDQEDARKQLERNQLVATKQAEGFITRYSPKYKQRQESLDILAKAASEGDAIVSAYLGMAVFAKNDEEAIAAVNNARSYWRELGYQLMADEYFVLPLLMQLVPFGADVAIKASAQRYRTVCARNAVTMLPILGSWRGTQTPHLTLISRDGQLMTWSQFDTDTNYGVVVCAASGAGKSFLVNEMTLSNLSTGGRTWIIDNGNSYMKLCEMLEGQYVRFDKDNTVGLNPFPLIKSYKDEEDMVATIIEMMAAPKNGLDDFQRAGLRRTLTEKYAIHGKATTVDIIEESLLQEPDRRLSDIGHQLFAFTSKGAYGHYFKGPNTFQQDNPFIVIELGELKGQPHLQQIVLFQLMYQINQAMFHGDPDQRKQMVIDESWEMLAMEIGCKFMETMYRRARKVHGSPIMITQGVNDFYNAKGAKPIIENSASMLLLKQKADAINSVQKEGRLPFGDWGYTQLRTLSTVKRSYSEILLSTDRGTGVGRLVVSDFQMLLYTTAPEEIAMINRYKANGRTSVEAINQILIDRKAA